MTQNEIDGGYSLGTATEGAFIYNLIWFYYNDFKELQNQAAYLYSKGDKRGWYYRLINTTFPTVQSGTYPFNIKYTIPGRNEVTTTYRINIKNIL